MYTATDDGKCSYHDLTTTLTRSKSDDKWTPWLARREDIEAVLSLWLLHFWRPDFEVSRNLWIMGPDNPDSRIMYDWWIFHGTERISIDSAAETCSRQRVSKSRVFDPLEWQKSFAKKRDHDGQGTTGVVTSDNLSVACSQFLLLCFLKDAVAVVEKLSGTMGISRGATPGQFLLVHESARGIAEALQQNGLVSNEDSYRLIIPTLIEAGILEESFDMHEGIVSVARAQTDSGVPGSDDTFERLIHLCQSRATAWSQQERWAEAGRTFLGLIESFSSILGSQPLPTIRAKETMEKFAINFVESSTSTPTSDKDRLGRFEEPFRLHAASAKGLIGQEAEVIINYTTFSLISISYRVVVKILR